MCSVIWDAEHSYSIRQGVKQGTIPLSLPVNELLVNLNIQVWCEDWPCILWHSRWSCPYCLPHLIASSPDDLQPMLDMVSKYMEVRTMSTHTNQKSLCLVPIPLPPTRGQSRVEIRSCQGVPAPGQQTLHSQQDFATHQLGVVLLCSQVRGEGASIKSQLYSYTTHLHRPGTNLSAKHPPEHVGVNQLGTKFRPVGSKFEMVRPKVRA